MGLALAGPLKIQGKPVTRVENCCAKRAYAVVFGAEKMKDGG